MPWITEAEQQSSIRISTLGSHLWRAIMAAHQEQPDLTYEEILTALLDVASRNVMRLRQGQHTPAESPGVPE